MERLRGVGEAWLLEQGERSALVCRLCREMNDDSTLIDPGGHSPRWFPRVLMPWCVSLSHPLMTLCHLQPRLREIMREVEERVPTVKLKVRRAKYNNGSDIRIEVSKA